MLAYLVFLYLPVSLIPLFSFNDSIQAAFPLQGFTLDWYATLSAIRRCRALWSTASSIGTIAAAGATLCGITVAYMDLYGRSPLAATISAIARLPILIPGVIVGISLLILVNLAGFGPSRVAIVLGHILVALPTTVVDHAQPLRRHPARPSARRRSISARATGRRSGASCCRSACRPSPRPSCWPS